MGGAWDYLGPLLELGLGIPTILDFLTVSYIGFLGPCGWVNLFPSSTRRSHGGSTYQKKSSLESLVKEKSLGN